jgi:DNA/RNA endonuclease G (NUC1)
LVVLFDKSNLVDTQNELPVEFTHNAIDEKSFANCQSSDKDLHLFNMQGLYLSCFSAKRQAPVWTMHYIIKEKLTHQKPRPDKGWTIPTQLPGDENTRSTGEVFMKTGRGRYSWDRGHLAPNSDFQSKEEKTATFSVINRAPQLAAINRGCWRCVETGLRTMLMKSDVYTKLLVITLLEYDDQIDPVEEKQKHGGKVHIPKSFNKIVYLVDDEFALKDEAFCITQTNSPLDYVLGKDTKLQEKPALPSVKKWQSCTSLVGTQWNLDSIATNKEDLFPVLLWLVHDSDTEPDAAVPPRKRRKTIPAKCQNTECNDKLARRLICSECSQHFCDECAFNCKKCSDIICYRDAVTRSGRTSLIYYCRKCSPSK